MPQSVCIRTKTPTIITIDVRFSYEFLRIIGSSFLTSDISIGIIRILCFRLFLTKNA